MVQRCLVALYVFGLKLWFRWGKLALSWVVNLFRPRLPWQRRAFASLEAYGEWLPGAVAWKQEPLSGAFDTFPSLEHIEWQLETRGRFEDDCDGLAYFSANNVLPFCDDPAECFVVTVIINPFEVGLLYAAHVMCIFKSEGAWRVISNDELLAQRWSTFEEALEQNPYCRGHRLLHVEVRDHNLRYLRSWSPEHPSGDETA